MNKERQLGSDIVTRKLHLHQLHQQHGYYLFLTIVFQIAYRHYVLKHEMLRDICAAVGIILKQFDYWINLL